MRTSAQKTPVQKTYEIITGTESKNIDFLGSNRQLNWLELSLVYGKSDKHATIYDSYNVELATKPIKSVKLSNVTELRFTALQMKKKFDIDNLTEKYILHKQFVA